LALCRIGGKDGRGVALAPVAELAAAVGGIDRVPKDINQRGVAHLFGIKGNLHCLSVATGTSGDLGIGGIFHPPACIARDSIKHARHRIKIRFDAPETAPRKDRYR